MDLKRPNIEGIWIPSDPLAAVYGGVQTVWPISCLPPNDLSSDSWFNYEDARDRTEGERQKKQREYGENNGVGDKSRRMRRMVATQPGMYTALY